MAFYFIKYLAQQTFSDMKNSFKNLQIIFLGLLIGQITFAVVANFMITNIAVSSTSILVYLVPAVMVSGILSGNYLFNASRKKTVARQGSIEDKFKAYRQSAIIRWAMMETGNLLAIVATFIEGKTFYFAMFAVGLLFFATTRPSVDDFCRQFEIPEAEKNHLK